MDDFGDDFTLSTTSKPNSPFQGTDVKKLSEEMDFKLKMAHKKRLEIKHFMSTMSSTSSKDPTVPEKKKRDKTLDVDGQYFLSRSFSFDSKDLRLNPYDPNKNCFSPRPKYLRYNPDRHREISARQENLSRVRRSASFDSRMHYHQEELESIVGVSLGASSREESVEEMDIIDYVNFKDEESKDEKEEEFDDFEEKSGWNLNVFLQCLLVTILLILTTFAISSMNSPNHGGKDLLNKKSLVVKTDKLAHMQELTKDLGDHVMECKKEEFYSKIDINHDEIWSKNESNVEETEDQEIISDQFHEPLNVIHAIEAAGKEIYSQFLGDDSDQGEVEELPEIFEKMVDEVVGEEDDNINKSELDEIPIKSSTFDPVFTAFIGVFILIPAALGIVYYSKKSRISTPITHQVSRNIKNLETFVNYSTLTRPDEVSSSQTTSSYLEPSIDSPSYGSFTVEKKIVKKKKSKKAEVLLSPVRRSSRIHNRSVISP